MNIRTRLTALERRVLPRTSCSECHRTVTGVFVGALPQLVLHDTGAIALNSPATCRTCGAASLMLDFTALLSAARDDGRNRR